MEFLKIRRGTGQVRADGSRYAVPLYVTKTKRMGNTISEEAISTKRPKWQEQTPVYCFHLPSLQDKHPRTEVVPSLFPCEAKTTNKQTNLSLVVLDRLGSCSRVCLFLMFNMFVGRFYLYISILYKISGYKFAVNDGKSMVNSIKA